MRKPALVLLLAAALLPAQAPPPGSLTSLLASSDPRQLAWGAYLAGEENRPALIPAIIPLLRHPHLDVQLAAADALIRLNARVASENLRGVHLNGEIDSVLVLISRNPRDYSTLLLDLLDTRLDDAEWTAVHALLSAAPPPGYAARLLREWKLRITVQVSDAPTGSGCGGAAGIIVYPPRDRAGFPPEYHHVLHLAEPAPGAVALVLGPQPVFYRRQLGPRTSYIPTDRDQSRTRLLHDLSGVALPETLANIRWTGPGAYLSEAGALAARVHQSLADLRQALLHRGLLQPAEPAEGTPPEFTLSDLRADRHIPLPAVAW